jgi:hypothetical protein
MDNRDWELGLAIGLFVDAGLAVGLAASGRAYTAADLPRLAWIGVWVAVLGLTFPATVRGLWGAGGAVIGAVRELWRQPDAPEVTAPLPVLPIPDDAEARAWQGALSRFFRAGDAAGGFSIRKLEGVIGSDAWARLTEFYSSDAGCRVLRVGPGDQGTVWNWGWEIDYVLQRIGSGSFPHPTGPVPDVQIYVNNASQRPAKRRATTAKTAIIDQ